jgi:transposase
MSNFRDGDRRTAFLLPPSVDEWLPERHLARFIVEVIDGLDVGGMIGACRGSGSAAHHPRMLLGVLIYGYATGMFSSRKLERATYDSVAFRYIAANDHPDHDTIATFRRRFLNEIEGLFVRVLLLAREMGVLKLGRVGLDGTKIHANASRHSALSWDHAGKLEAQLKAEVVDLLARAEAADEADVPDGVSIPEELALREKRLARLAEARARIEAQAKERYARERAEHEAKLAARGQDRRDRQEARRQAARAAGRRAAAEGPDQSHRRRLADHAGFGRRLRAELQRASRGGRGEPAGRCGRWGSGAKRQAAARTDAGQDRGSARTPGRGRNAAGGRRLFQRGECRGLPGG